jgi:hypothetical protein
MFRIVVFWKESVRSEVLRSSAVFAKVEDKALGGELGHLYILGGASGPLAKDI